jgi:hypothetical protein
MKTPTKVAIAAALLTLGVQGAAHAYSNAVNRVVNQLRSQGYSSVQVHRTLMGRMKIEAQGNGGSREIVIDPNTGHVFRDRQERENSWRSRSDSHDRDDDDRGHNDRDHDDRDHDDHDNGHDNDHDD